MVSLILSKTIIDHAKTKNAAKLAIHFREIANFQLIFCKVHVLGKLPQIKCYYESKVFGIIIYGQEIVDRIKRSN